jgi:hypothetical protein
MVCVSAAASYGNPRFNVTALPVLSSRPLVLADGGGAIGPCLGRGVGMSVGVAHRGGT